MNMNLKEQLKIIPDGFREHLDDERRVMRELLVGKEDILSLKQDIITSK